MTTPPSRIIYLDTNATCPPCASAVTAMTPFLSPLWGNPSSPHHSSAAPRAALADARASLASLLHCAPEELIFCSGGTESINTVLKGLVLTAWASAGRRGAVHAISTAGEHPAVTEALSWLVGMGFVEVTVLPLSPEGCVSPAAAEAAVRPSTAVCTLQLANNETGCILDVAGVARALASAAERLGLARPPPLHVDASQAVGKIPVDCRALGCDFLSVAGHKLGAPPGVGATFARGGWASAPGAPCALLHGGGQEAGARAGTENVAYAVALGAAAAAAGAALAAGGAARAAALRERLAQALRERCLALAGLEPLRHGPRAQAPGLGCLPNTLSLGFPGAGPAGELVRALRDVVAVSAGAACHSSGGGGSRVLAAMGVPRAAAVATLRCSLGAHTTEADCDAAAEHIARAVAAAVARGREAQAGTDLVQASAAVAEAQAGVDLAQAPAAAAEAQAVVDPAQVAAAPAPAPAMLPSPAANPAPAGSPPLTTAALFLADTHAFHCEATVTGVARAAAGGMQLLTEAGAPADGFLGPLVAPWDTALVTDATVAHAQGGGQPSDRGLILLRGREGLEGLAFEFLAVRSGAAGAMLHYGRFLRLSAPLEAAAAAEAADALPAEGGCPGAAPLDPDRAAAAAAALPGAPASLHIHRPHRRLAARLHSAGHILDLAVRRVWAQLAEAGTPLEALKPGKG